MTERESRWEGDDDTGTDNYASQNTDNCSNFLSGRAKCSNSRPGPPKNLGRTSGITLEIQEFTGTWHFFLLVQKPQRRIYILFSSIDSFVFCSDIHGLITKLGVTCYAIEWRIF